MFLFIISGVGNQMNMYDVKKKMHEISVSSSNVCHPMVWLRKEWMT